MARLPELTERDQIPQDKRSIFDAIARSRGKVGAPFSVLMNSPEVAGRAAHLGAYVRFETTLSPPDRELAVLTTSRELDCDFEWSSHLPLALEVGIRTEAIDAVANDGDLDPLTEGEATIVRFGRELLRAHRVSDGTFQAARDRLGPQGVTDLVATFGYYSMLACVLNALEVEPPPGSPRLPPRP